MHVPATTEGTAAVDMSAIEAMSGMVNAGDAPTMAGPGMLKINYDEDSIFSRGSWVFGQKKADGVITEQGTAVDKVIILTTRFRWSYYCEKTKKAVSTAIFEAGQQPPDKAEADAKCHAMGGKGLKFQIVIFGMAVVGDEFKEFISYQGGTGYGAFRDWLKELTVYQGKTLPPFAFVTQFTEAEKKKNGSITYWIPHFSRGVGINSGQVPFFFEKRNEAYQYIDFINEKHLSKAAEEPAPAAAMPAAGGEYVAPAHTVGEMPTFEMPPTPAAPPAPAAQVLPALPATPAGMGAAQLPATPAAIPATTTAPAHVHAPPAASPTEPEYDIEAQMMNIING
jgi:hypothetical protein